MTNTNTQLIRVQHKGIECFSVGRYFICTQNLTIEEPRHEALVSGNHPADQIFSWDAGMLYTGMHEELYIPSEGELHEVMKLLNPNFDPRGSWQESRSIERLLELSFHGIQDALSRERSSADRWGCYWTSTVCGNEAQCVIITADGKVLPGARYSRSDKMSVRCFVHQWSNRTG